MSFLKIFPLFFCLIVLTSCSTTEKVAVSPSTKTKKTRPQKKISREVAHLKTVSEFKGRNWQFVIKKMKEVIKNYSKMKDQLALIENQLESLLQKKAFEKPQPEEETLAGTEEGSLAEENLEKEHFTEKPAGEEAFLEETPLYQSQKEALKKISESELALAHKLFKEKEYEKAISHFQKYRDENPKGPFYLTATFYIGLSFQRLKMPIEAQVFFKEIVHSHPESIWGQKAKKLLED